MRKCSNIKIFGDSESKNGGNSDSDSDSDSDSLISSYENGEQACTPTLLPPPIASYSTYEFLQEAIRTWTKEQGYDLVVSRSYKHNSKIVRRCLVCGRAGKSQNNRKLTENDRKRKTSTNKIGCPMGLYVIADNRENPEGSWSIKYKTTDNSQIHNHGPAFVIANHRRDNRDNNLASEIQRHSQSGITTAQSMTILQKSFPDLIQTSQDIRNIKSRFRKENLNSMSPTEALLLCLKNNSFFYRYSVDEGNHLHQLFLAHPKSISLFKDFHDIIMLDCTYKTNRYFRSL